MYIMPSVIQFSMTKFFLRLGIFLLVMALTVISTLLVVKWLEADRITGEKAELNVQIADLQADITALAQNTNPDGTKSLRYRDSGMDVSIDYPSDWSLVNQIEAKGYGENMDSSGEEIIGPIFTKYQTEFSKGSTKITFSKMLGGVGAITQLVDETKYDLVIVKDGQLGRIKLKSETSWMYVEIIPDAVNECQGDSTNGTVCYGPFFPGFGTEKYASSAKVVGTDAEALKVADQIAVSALRD